MNLLGRIDADALCAAFADYGAYDNIAYFACCNVLREEEGAALRARLSQASGMRAVIGYATTVDWMASLVADMLFLHRFYRDPSPGEACGASSNRCGATIRSRATPGLHLIT